MEKQLHAHVETYSTDCDGQYPGGETVEMTFEEQAGHDQDNWFGDLNFMNRVFVRFAGPYAVLRMTVTVDEDGFEVEEQHDEGVRRAEVKWCRDDSCEPVKPWRRDLTAERAGY